MKRLTKPVTLHLMLASLLIIATTLQSQASLSNYPHTEGYWVVETNAISKDFTMIRMYNADNQVIYEERLEGVSLDITRRKNINMLNKTLKIVQQNTIIARQIKGYTELVASSIAKRR